jgi:hypothetical protein
MFYASVIFQEHDMPTFELFDVSLHRKTNSQQLPVSRAKALELLSEITSRMTNRRRYARQYDSAPSKT